MTCARSLVSLALAWFAVGTAAPAWGARVAPLAPYLSPAKTELRERFHDALARGLQQGAPAGVEVMSGSDVRVRLLANDDLLSCTSGPCLVRAVGELRADRLALAEVTISGKNYAILLRLVDQGGAEVWRTTERCDICTVREADEAIGKAAARMSPWVVRPGPTDRAKAVAMAPAVPATAATTAAVSQGPQVIAHHEPRRTHFRQGWIAALAVGGAFALSSIPFLYYAAKGNGTTCDPSVALNKCPTLYDSKGNLGAGLGLLIGAGLVGGSVAFGTLFYLDQRAQTKAAVQVSLLPTWGGSMLGLEGQF